MNIAALTANLYSDDTETNSLLKNDKDNFYRRLKSLGFDFEDLDEETRMPKSIIPVLAGDFEAVLQFNSALLTLHRKKYVNIIDAVVYLTTDYLETEDIMKVMQTNVLGVLSAELSSKHKLFSIKPTSAINKFIK